MKREYPITVLVNEKKKTALVYGANEKEPFNLKGLRKLGVYGDAAALGEAMLAWAESGK